MSILYIASHCYLDYHFDYLITVLYIILHLWLCPKRATLRIAMSKYPLLALSYSFLPSTTHSVLTRADPVDNSYCYYMMFLFQIDSPPVKQTPSCVCA